MDRESILEEIKRVELSIGKKTAGRGAGGYKSAFKGHGIEIAGVREYSQDDDYRLIDWNSTARAGKPHTRILQEERDLEVFILADISPSMFMGGALKNRRKTKIETSAVISAVIGLSADENSDRTGCILFSDRIEKEIPPLRGRKHSMEIVSSILSSRPAGKGSDLSLALNALPKVSMRKGICVIISDFMYPVPWKDILAVSGRTETVCFRITDPVEINAGYDYFCYTEDCDFMEHEKSRKPRISSMASDTEGYFSAVKKDFTKYKVPLADISTEDNVFVKINKFFKYRRI